MKGGSSYPAIYGFLLKNENWTCTMDTISNYSNNKLWLPRSENLPFVLLYFLTLFINLHEYK